MMGGGAMMGGEMLATFTTVPASLLQAIPQTEDYLRILPKKKKKRKKEED